MHKVYRVVKYISDYRWSTPQPWQLCCLINSIEIYDS